MAFNYTDPRTSARDAVRFLVNDTTETGHLLEDEEILFLLDENNANTYLAAADAADRISVKFSNQVTAKSVGPLSLTYARRSDEFRTLAGRLRDQARSKNPPMPYAGGISRSDKIANDDTDESTKDFALGQMDTPGGMNGDDLTDLSDRDRGGW